MVVCGWPNQTKWDENLSYKGRGLIPWPNPEQAPTTKPRNELKNHAHPPSSSYPNAFEI